MSKKGDVEINEIFIVLLLLVGVLAAVWVATENTSYDEGRIVKVTGDSIGELIDEGLYVSSEYFYSTHSEGDYKISTHRWALIDMDEAPDAEPKPVAYAYGSDIPNNPVLFEGKYLYEIRGFGAKIYERTDAEEPMDIEAVAIFLGTSNTMDEYYEDQESFMIRFYEENTQREILENCNIQDYKDAITESGTFIRFYYIHCSVIWEGPY